jgi:hypothetical protein
MPRLPESPSDEELQRAAEQIVDAERAVARYRPSDYVYRVTEKRKNPDYWQNKVKTRIVSYRSVQGILKCHSADEITIQRALIGEWEDFEYGN